MKRISASRVYSMLLLLAICLCTSVADAQSNGKSWLTVLDTSKTISLTGEARMRVEPDFYRVEVTVSDRYCKKGESIESLYENLKSILKANKVSLDSLTLKDTKKERNFFGSMAEEFTETRVYSITLGNSALFKKVRSMVEENSITKVVIAETNNSKLETYKASLYEKAVKDARAKADVVANANSQKILTTISVNELSFSDDTDLVGELAEDVIYKLYLKLRVVYKTE